MKKKFLLLSLIVIFAVSAFAHVPAFLTSDSFAKGTFLVKDIELSQIFYYVFSAAEEITFVFEGLVGQHFHMLFGVPKEIEGMDTTVDFRPNLTVYDPDGEIVEDFALESIDPEVMYEFFGDTYSYLYVRHDSTLAKEGIYSIKVKAEDPGRSWITFGKKERFTASQIIAVPRWIREIRSFHYLRGLAKWELYGLGILGAISAALVLLVFL